MGIGRRGDVERTCRERGLVEGQEGCRIARPQSEGHSWRRCPSSLSVRGIGYALLRKSLFEVGGSCVCPCVRSERERADDGFTCGPKVEIGVDVCCLVLVRRLDG